MKFDRYLSRIPELHTWDEGKTWNSGGFEAFHLKAFHRLVGRSATAPVVLETGAGNSTLAFAYARPARLISIAPDQELFARIRSSSPGSEVMLSRPTWICRCSKCTSIGPSSFCRGWPTAD